MDDPGLVENEEGHHQMAHEENCVQSVQERRSKAGLKVETLLLMLMGVVILQMITNIGLFLRMNQLQQEVLTALKPLQITQGINGKVEGLEIGIEAPSFKLPDTRERLTGLEDFAGRRVFLIFSSVRCPACIERYPDMKALSEQHQDVQVIMISNGSPEQNQQLVEEQHFSFPVLKWDDTVAKAYLLPGTPFFYAVDENGSVSSKGFAGSLKQMEELIRAGDE